MAEWEPAQEDWEEATRFWAVADAMSLGPETLAQELVQQDPLWAALFQEFLEHELALKNPNDFNDLAQLENPAKSVG
jgi:hypothetical protein